MRLLLVEGDIKIASFLVKGLRAAGFAVDQAADGEEGLQLAVTEPYDAAIVDLMFPRKNGLTLIREMRLERVNTPFDPQTNVVEARISRLREKIDRNQDQKLIHTVRGAGYVLKETGSLPC